MANNVTLSYPSAFHHQFLDLNGKPLTGGKLYTYSAGTPTPVPTYKTIGDTSSTNTNTNPIILDNAGMAYIVIETDKAYKFVLFDKNDAKIAEWDNVTGNIGGGGGGSEDIVVVGTPNEIDVSGSVIQGVKRYVVSLSNSVKITILQLIGLYNNVLNSLGNKADKVQGATAGNLAALDANGNLTDSGSKAADFKTKQTPVTDPSASGAGLEFIDSISQNANGEITPHKKAVQDGTTAQKGVVQLQDSIGSTESATDKAVTPHAVREAINAAVSSAYHAAGTKSVAQLTSSLLVAENEGCVYNITDSGTTTSDFVDGVGHPINAGDNVGVCDVGGGVYKFDLLSGFVDLTNYLTKTGDASNATSTLTKASGDTSTLTSGSKLSAIFTAISSFFASLKALAFKDMVSNSDINGTISDSHIASASTWNGKQDSLGISSSGDTGKFLNERGVFATPNYPSVPSVINNLTSTSTTDALSAAQGKALNDGKVDVRTGKIILKGNDPQVADLWHCIAKTKANSYDNAGNIVTITRRGLFMGNLYIGTTNDTNRNIAYLYTDLLEPSTVGVVREVDGSDVYMSFWVKRSSTYDAVSFRIIFPERHGLAQDVTYPFTTRATAPDGITYPIRLFPRINTNSNIGSPTIPVYVDSNGQLQPCDVLSGGTSNFNRTFTTTYTVGYTDQYITTLIKNDNTDLIADYVAWHNANYGKLSSPPMIIISVSARDTNVANAGLISLSMYRTGNGCDVFGEKYAYMGNQHGSRAYNTQYFTDQTFVSGSAYYLNIRNETQNTMWAAGTILDISIRIVAHAVSVT